MGKAGADEFMAELEHPLKPVVEALRKVVRATDPSLVEGIKWNAPSYAVAGDDRLTFNLHAKDKVRLIFHRGAKAKDTKGKGRLIEDPSGLLEWASDARAIANFTSLAEVKANKSALQGLIRAWLAATGA